MESYGRKCEAYQTQNRNDKREENLEGMTLILKKTVQEHLIQREIEYMQSLGDMTKHSVISKL